MSSSNERTTLAITDKTIKYSGQVYQLKNVTQVAKYRAKRRRWLGVLLALVIGAGGVALLPVRDGAAAGLLALGFAVTLLLWTLLRKRRYLLMLETSSGSAELFTSKNEAFIDDLIATISDVMENQVEGTHFIAYTDKSKIIDNSTRKVVKGDEVAGDKFDNIKLKNSQFVSRSPNAIVSNTIHDLYGEAVAKAIDDLARHIEEHNDPGSAALLDKIREEITGKSVSKPKVAALWNSLVTILPEAAKVAASIATIAGAIL